MVIAGEGPYGYLFDFPQNFHAAKQYFLDRGASRFIRWNRFRFLEYLQ